MAAAPGRQTYDQGTQIICADQVTDTRTGTSIPSPTTLYFVAQNDALTPVTVRFQLGVDANLVYNATAHAFECTWVPPAAGIWTYRMYTPAGVGIGSAQRQLEVVPDTLV